MPPFTINLLLIFEDLTIVCIETTRSGRDRACHRVDQLGLARSLGLDRRSDMVGVWAPGSL